MTQQLVDEHALKLARDFIAELWNEFVDFANNRDESADDAWLDLGGTEE